MNETPNPRAGQANPPLRVGMFGGAFDPPHWAHRALAETALGQLRLDHLHILPTGHAWHKPRQLSPAEHRVAMCKLAFDGLAVEGGRLTVTGGGVFAHDPVRLLLLFVEADRLDLAEAAQMRGCTTPGIRALSEQGQ